MRTCGEMERGGREEKSAVSRSVKSVLMLYLV